LLPALKPDWLNRNGTAARLLPARRINIRTGQTRFRMFIPNVDLLELSIKGRTSRLGVISVQKLNLDRTLPLVKKFLRPNSLAGGSFLGPPLKGAAASGCDGCPAGKDPTNAGQRDIPLHRPSKGESIPSLGCFVCPQSAD